MNELFLKEPKDYLIFELELRKARRPAYSMRAMARDLKISASGLNDFMKGRVGMSEARIDQVAKQLGWSTSRRDHFRDLILSRFDRDPAVRQSAALRSRARLKQSDSNLGLAAFKAISDWYHLAILELCALENNLDADSLSQYLSIQKSTIQQAVSRLIKLGLLKNTKQGLKPEEDTSHFGDEGHSEAVRSFQTQMLQLAQNALYENESPLHDSQSMIFSVRQDDIEKMNREIRRATLDIVSRYAQVENPNSVQAITLQAFPIWTKKKISKKSLPTSGASR